MRIKYQRCSIWHRKTMITKCMKISQLTTQRELYSSRNREEIAFWINYKDRELSIHDIALLSLENEDLFQLAMKREDVDFAFAEGVIGFLEEWDDDTGVITSRINSIRQRM